MKAFNSAFCILFILFAALQYNDPDPYLWIPVYLYSAWLCYSALGKNYYPKAIIAGVIFYSLYAVYLLFDKTGVFSWLYEHHAENIATSMKATKPWIEETREFGGLIILIAVNLFNYYKLKGQYHKVSA